MLRGRDKCVAIKSNIKNLKHIYSYIKINFLIRCEKDDTEHIC